MNYYQSFDWNTEDVSQPARMFTPLYLGPVVLSLLSLPHVLSPHGFSSFQGNLQIWCSLTTMKFTSYLKITKGQLRSPQSKHSCWNYFYPICRLHSDSTFSILPKTARKKKNQVTLFMLVFQPLKTLKRFMCVMYIYLHEYYVPQVCRALWRPEALPGPLELKLHMESNPGPLQELVKSPQPLNFKPRRAVAGQCLLTCLLPAAFKFLN